MTNDGNRLAIGAPLNAYGEDVLGKISFYGNMNLINHIEDEYIDKRKLLVYPNPSRGSFKFSLDESYHDRLSYSLYDAFARPLIFNKKIESAITEFYLKQAGIYFLSLTDDHSVL